MFCWFRLPAPRVPTPMKNERFCQMTLFCNGFEKPAQPGCPVAGQVIFIPVVVSSKEEFCMLVTPADCGHDAVDGPLGPFATQFPAGALAAGVPMLCVSTPEVVSESLLEMVLFMMDTFSASRSEIPAPSQPAMLFTIMLLVMETLFQSFGFVLKVETSVPLTCWKTDATAAAAVGRVALDQVGIDHQVVARTVAQSRRAIRVRYANANRVRIGGAHNLDTAAVGGNGGIAGSVEDDRVCARYRRSGFRPGAPCRRPHRS